jgi:hypothetical protein
MKGSLWRSAGTPSIHVTMRAVSPHFDSPRRDEADIPMITSFCRHKLTKFNVITEEIRQETALAV